MKTKYIVLVICIILLTTYSAAANPQTIKTHSLKNTTVSNVDAPIWEIGDTWTYQIEDISLIKQQENKSISLDATFSDLSFTVTNTDGNEYTLDMKITVDGQMKISVDRGNGPINVSLIFSDLDVSGTVLVDKSTLGRKEISVGFKREKISIEIEQSLIPLPKFLQQFSARITMNLGLTYDPSLSLVTFPLNTGTFWNLPSTNITIDGSIQSFYLNLINFINKIAKLFHKDFLPAEIAALLPIIHIEETLTTFGYENVFRIPAIPSAYICLNTENISVPAGSYEAYNITLFGGLAQCYYAPTAGNIVKIVEETMTIKLLSTNYT